VRLSVGRVVRPHGVRGEVLVEIVTDTPHARFAPASRLHVEARGSVLVAASRPHQGRWLLQLAGVDDRDAAEALRGAALSVEVTDDELDVDGEFFPDVRLIGLRARRHGVDGSPGDALGVVAGVLHLPAQDLLEVQTEAGPVVLVPFVRAIVPVVDLAAGLVLIDPPGGLFDDGGGVMVEA